jgi:hypothetical protein
MTALVLTAGFTKIPTRLARVIRAIEHAAARLTAGCPYLSRTIRVDRGQR